MNLKSKNFQKTKQLEDEISYLKKYIDTGKLKESSKNVQPIAMFFCPQMKKTNRKRLKRILTKLRNDKKQLSEETMHKR